jgi:8-oxo-dGTP pyrophosphatase MutT (NUDIX family)
MTPIATAATILLLRPDGEHFEVFLVQRHRKSAFMPRMWVFPGGRIEPGDAAIPADRTRGGTRAIARFGWPEDVGRATLIGGVRETFEEAGIWLGEGTLAADARERLASDAIAFSDLLGPDVDLDLDRLHPWSRWVTPEGEARRFDTAFLIAVADERHEGLHDERETVASGWFRPRRVLDAGLAEMGLAPPTWWALTELAALPDVDAVLAAAAQRSLAPIRPVLASGEHGFGIALPGHPSHPEPARPGLPVRIALGASGGWEADLA